MTPKDPIRRRRAFGLILRGLLESVGRCWMAAARVLARANTFIVLGAMYYLLFVPMGVLMRLVSTDPLDDGSPDTGTYWKTRVSGRDVRSYERQF